ncbi:MAG TPA: HEAT repeat domain-containing protein [Pirellulales bacterium]|nr:HEAT repeat domain-containing protein [Pirellulales bacterium]
MSISIVCECGKKLVARDEQAGLRAKCPACGKILQVPQPAAPPASRLPDPPSAEPSTTPRTAVALYEGQPLTYWFDLLQDIDPMQRRKATEVLATVGAEAAAEQAALVERLEADHVLVRHWAIVCLAQLASAAQPSLESLVARLEDQEPLIRQKAAWAVGAVRPEAQPFVAALLRGLNDKAAEVRAAAIERFRRDLKTAGISRFRYWACSCGRVALKLDLEQRLRQMVDAPDQVSWQGELVCTKCQARYVMRDVYVGKHDVPEKYWAKLRARYGDSLRVPDEFFGDLAAATQDSGYRILDEAQPAGEEVPSLAAFSAPLLAEAFDEVANLSYKIADEPPPMRPVELLEKAPKQKE